MNKRKIEFLEQLKEAGIKEEIIKAFAWVDQDLFFDKIFKGSFYEDEPLPIGCGEKSDSPFVLAKMLCQLLPGENCRILEIGTGSGYSTAILSRLFNEVVSVEFHEELALKAKERLEGLNINNVKFLAGNITDHNSLSGIFDRIIILASCAARPLYLLPYLESKGVLVFPMGPAHQQQITAFINEPAENGSLFRIHFYDLCYFDPIKD